MCRHGQHGQKRGQRGTGQIREKVQEDENGIGITDAGSLSLKAGEGAGVANKYGRTLNHESFRPNKARQAPGRKLQGSAKYLQADRMKNRELLYRSHLVSRELTAQVKKTLLIVISLISFFMAQLLVRDLEDAVVQALRRKAAEE